MDDPLVEEAELAVARDVCEGESVVVLQLVERRHQVVLEAGQRLALGQLLDEVLAFESEGKNICDVVVEITAERIVANQRVVQRNASEGRQLQAVLLQEGLARNDHDVFPGPTGSTCGFRCLLLFRGFSTRNVGKIQLKIGPRCRVRWRRFVAATRRRALWFLGQRHFCDA